MKKNVKKFFGAMLVFAMVISVIPNMAYAETTDSSYSDNNDIPSNATTLTSNGVLNGILSTDEDVDYYKYTVDVTGYYNFTFTDVNAQGGQWEITVYDSSLKKLQSIVNSDYSCTSINYNFKKGTVIYVKVNYYYGDTINKVYSISVNAQNDSKWEQENNDTRANANVITSKSAILGNLYSDEDVDYYKYTVDVTGYYNFTFADVNAQGGQWETTIYDSSLKELKSIVNSDYSCTSINYNFKKGTVLYIKVSYYYGVTFGREYSLTVNAKKSANWEQENDDSYSKAISLKVNTTKYGNLYQAEDVDYYSYKAKKAGTLKTSFKFDADTVGFGWRVTIYDSSKKEIKTVTSITADKVISIRASKGKKYYIVVRADNGYSALTGITYALKIK